MNLKNLEWSVSKLAGVFLIIMSAVCVILKQYDTAFQMAGLGSALIGAKTVIAGSVKKSENRHEKQDS